MVKKSIISNINRKFISKIKELIIIHYGQKDVNRTFTICEEHIYGKRKIRFRLVYKHDLSIETLYQSSGGYFLENGISYITIYITNGCKFDFSQFEELYFDIKGILYHEIEHHLQRLKAPFREKLIAYDDSSIEYVEAPCELEAYLKELIFLSKNKNIPLYQMICSRSEIMEGELKFHFIKKMFEYIYLRKDLNIII